MRRLRMVSNRGEERLNKESQTAGEADRSSLVGRRWSILLLIAVVAVATIGLIIWAGVAAWQRPCRTTAGPVLVGTSGCPSLIWDFAPLLIAFGFWAIGLLIVRFADRRPGPSDNTFLLIAGALAAGKLSAMGSYLGGRLFYLLLACLIPLTFHFHYKLLSRPIGSMGRVMLAVLYGLAAGLSLPFLVLSIPRLQQRDWFLPLRTGVRLSLALSVGLAVLLLLRDYRMRASSEVRWRVRLVAFGTLFAFAPLALLSLLPDTLGLAHFPYEWTFLWLLISPLTYAYSLFRHRWAWADAPLNRAAVYYLLITLLLVIYLVAAAGLNYLVSNPSDQWPLFGALLGVALLLVFAPLKETLQGLVNWIWHGGEVSYLHVVGQLAEALALTLDRDTLSKLLVEDLTALMGLSRGLLLLKEGDEELVVAGSAGFEASELATLHLPSDGHLVAYLQTVAKPVHVAQGRWTLAEDSSHSEKQALLSMTGVTLCVPLVSGGALQGLLLLGHGSGSDTLSPEEERILTTLAYQGGIAAYNVRLMEQVQAGREELARAHRQLLVGREQEQRRLAHELHDSAVQQLLGISYQLVEARHIAAGGNGPKGQAASKLASLLEASRQAILDVVRGLRSLIGELRPAGLEELGLGAALEGYVARLGREGGPGAPAIHLDLDGGSGVGLPEPLTICLFRVAQEALRNALKHAGARRITVSLHMHPGEAILSICDDGCGFRVPARLSRLTRSNHFGLVGMAERVAWAGGRLTIQSRPGMGTEVQAWIPYDENKESVTL